MIKRYQLKLFFLLLVTIAYSCTSTKEGSTNKSVNAGLKKMPDSLIASGAQLKLVSKQFRFTEGPAADSHGNVYFTDQPNDRIWKYDTDGNLSIFMEKTGRANGLYFDKQNNLYACADENNQLWKISPDKNVTILLTDLDGKNFNGPNDLWLAPAGGIYFTDPLYKRPYWSENRSPIEGEKVYYLPVNSKQPVVVDDKIVKPNGIIGTADGKFLYVADIGDNKTYRYKIELDGTLSNKTFFAPQGSDGLTLDEYGNLYLTGKGVSVYNKEGNKILEIPVPENWTANLCFGGKNFDKLIITASQALYELQMNVKGMR